METVKVKGPKPHCDGVVRRLMRRLGGPKAVAERLPGEVAQYVITQWSQRDQVPWRWRAEVAAMASEICIELTDEECVALSLRVLEDERRAV